MKKQYRPDNKNIQQQLSKLDRRFQYTDNGFASIILDDDPDCPGYEIEFVLYAVDEDEQYDLEISGWSLGSIMDDGIEMTVQFRTEEDRLDYYLAIGELVLVI